MKRMISEGQSAAARGGEVLAGAGGLVPEAAGRPLRELMDDRLLERSRDSAGGLRLTGGGLHARRAGPGSAGAGA